jgi:peptide/nickel transport system permease protein
MLTYISKRILLAFLSVWVISILSFVIVELPQGDAIDRMFARTFGSNEALAIEMLENLRLRLGLDQPKYVRYSKWIWRLMHGDLGQTMMATTGIESQRSLKVIIGDRLWTTIALTGFTVVVTWTFAIPIGIYSAVRQHSVGDYVFTVIGFTGLAVPDFLLGLVLMYLAYAYFDQSVGGLFSANYINAPWDLDKARDLLNHLWIPALVLGTSGTAGLIRVMRNNLLDELGKPYVITARAKGLPSWKANLKYPLRVAINPFISTIGYLLPSLVSGSVIVSVVLSLPTLGPILLNAILNEDTTTAGFIILMLGALTVIGTLVSDILLAVVDPRIRLTNR